MIDGQRIADIAKFLEAKEGIASKRAQIGRLYYAAFIEARRYCEGNLGFVPTGGPDDHGEIRKLMDAKDPALAMKMDNLRKLRNQADYRDHIPSQKLEGNLRDARQLASDISRKIEHVGGRAFYEHG